MRLFVEFEGKIKICEVGDDLVLTQLIANILKESTNKDPLHRFKVFFERKEVENKEATLKANGIAADSLVKIISADECSGNEIAYESFGPNTDLDILDKNFIEAAKEIPEAFDVVQLNYVKVKIGSESFTALVDTGAQVSILSEKAAQRCGIRNLVDSRCQVTTKGLAGETEALGRIMKCEVQTEKSKFLFSFVVLAENGPECEMIIGIDMLQKYKALIDYKNRELHLGADIRLPFISDKEASNQKSFGVYQRSKL